MKNPEKKLQLKKHKEELKKRIRWADGIYSQMKYPDDIALPSEITKAESESAFLKLWTSFYKRKRKMAVTKIKTCKSELVAKTLSHQLEYLKQNPNTQHILSGFTHKEAVDIYEEALTIIPQ